MKTQTSENTLSILEFSDDDAPAWDQYVQDHPKGTFCHLAGWKRVIRKTFGHKPYYLLARQGNEVCGVLPLFYVKTLLFGRFLVSTPLAVYGGILSETAEVEHALFGRARELCRELKADYLELRNPEESLPDLPGTELYVTFLQELFQDGGEKNWNAMPRETRRLVRKAREAGLVAESNRTSLNSFYNVYSHSVKQLGTPVFPKSLFRNFLQEFPEHSDFLEVKLADRTVASVMVFYFRDQVLPYYGGSLREFSSNSYGANNFMYWELMQRGIDKGYRLFDFGRSKVGTGPYNFKRHFNMVPKPLPYKYLLHRRNELPNVNPTNPKLQMFIKIWRQLPIGVANILGPRLVRNFP